jgi:hypothetical protein
MGDKSWLAVPLILIAFFICLAVVSFAPEKNAKASERTNDIIVSRYIDAEWKTNCYYTTGGPQNAGSIYCVKW